MYSRTRKEISFSTALGLDISWPLSRRRISAEPSIFDLLFGRSGFIFFQMNSLLGVLLRFRRETTAVMCDIEQMFHFFHVGPEHRDFLRFLWYENNTPGRRIIEYRMNVQVEVMEAFPAEDRGKGVRDLDLRHDSLPAQGSLGVYWNLEEDTFTFKVCLPEKPFTRTGGEFCLS